MTVVANPTILDAARRVFEQYGARRANVEDVARTAGVSRSTLYRAYPNKEALLEAVLVTEFDAFLTELDRVAAGLPPQEAVVECFARGMSLTREIPLLARLTETEPELMLRVAWTYLLNPSGRLDVTDEHEVRDYARRFLAPLVH